MIRGTFVWFGLSACCSALQCVAVRCSALQCVAECKAYLGKDVHNSRQIYIVWPQQRCVVPVLFCVWIYVFQSVVVRYIFLQCVGA